MDAQCLPPETPPNEIISSGLFTPPPHRCRERSMGRSAQRVLLTWTPKRINHIHSSSKGVGIPLSLSLSLSLSLLMKVGRIAALLTAGVIGVISLLASRHLPLYTCPVPSSSPPLPSFAISYLCVDFIPYGSVRGKLRTQSIK